MTIGALARRAPNVSRALADAPSTDSVLDRAQQQREQAADSVSANDSAGGDGPSGDGGGEQNAAGESESSDGQEDGSEAESEATPAPTEQPAPEEGGILQTIAQGMQTLIALEQSASTLPAAVPFPGLPALRVMDVAIGLPHAHNHPPNLVPPAPPVPIPSIGPVIPVPILSGAMATNINGSAAARCGDMGAGVWCGGYFPLFEVYLGSASVWIEGARAARVAVDVTKHCIFTTPKPSDPPMGPMFGATVAGSNDVMIGGMPMPSLFSIALGAAFRLLFRGVGLVFRGASALARSSSRVARASARAGAGASQRGLRLSARLRAAGRFLRNPRAALANRAARQARLSRQVRRLLGPNGAVRGSLRFRVAVVRDLRRIARTPVGRELLRDLRNSGRRIRIDSPTSGVGAFRRHAGHGPHCVWDEWGDATRRLEYPGPGRPANGTIAVPRRRILGMSFGRVDTPVHIGGPGAGTGSTTVYNPSHFPSTRSPGSPSDVILFHELNHARNMADGGLRQVDSFDPNWNATWNNMEEYSTVQMENVYRAERGGVPQRIDYMSGLP